MVAVPAYLSQPPLTLEQQAALVEEHGLSTLLFCHDSWALRHRFQDETTGEVRRARCDSWQCPYCGPRKVDGYRQIIKAAEPTLFITFTRVGWTVAEASRVLTTIMQYLRRGSKGKGPNRVGARPAYPLEWFATLERHSDFEQVGFHWHVLVNGVDYIEHDHLREALRSATGGRSYIVHVERVRSDAVGYVTKYLTKDIFASEQGTTQRTRKVRKPVLETVKTHTVTRLVAGPDGEQREVMEERPFLLVSKQEADGTLCMQEEEEVVERASKARRIRYSRHFFPFPAKELRRRVFSGQSLSDEPETVEGELLPGEQGDEERQGGQAEEQVVMAAEDAVGQADAPVRSAWSLVEVEPFSRETEVYEQRRQKALLEAVDEVRCGRKISRRVVGLWVYQQRQQHRQAG